MLRQTRRTEMEVIAVLLPNHRDDLRKSGLTDETIASLGFYSDAAKQVESCHRARRNSILRPEASNHECYGNGAE